MLPEEPIQLQGTVCLRSSATFYSQLVLVSKAADMDGTNVVYFREYLHWLKIHHKNGTVEKIMDFMPSIPPYSSGLHRYIFLAFKTDDSVETVDKVDSRPYFKIAKYVKRNKLGSLTAINFYLTEKVWRENWKKKNVGNKVGEIRINQKITS